MFKKLASLFCLGVGIFIFMQVVLPILSFKVWEATTLKQSIPLIDPSGSESKVLGVSVENVGNFPAFISNKSRREGLQYSEYSLTISKIKLTDVKVKVDVNDFEENLGQLPGTALPGERGNVFITGHSSLTQLYAQNNFKTIFSHLPEVKKGDQVELNVLGQKFMYTVESLKIVDPKDISVINPPDNEGRYLTLMTCVPPGFNTKRLIVLARLNS